jgi:hypothetical protein
MFLYLHCAGQQALTCRVFCSARVRLSVKTRDEYLDVQTLPSALLAREGLVGPARPGAAGPKAIAGRELPRFIPYF